MSSSFNALILPACSGNSPSQPLMLSICLIPSISFLTDCSYIVNNRFLVMLYQVKPELHFKYLASFTSGMWQHGCPSLSHSFIKYFLLSFSHHLPFCMSKSLCF